MIGWRRSSARRTPAWVGAVLLLSAVPALAAGPKAPSAREGQDWVQSPYRHFREARSLPGGRAVVFDEAEDPALNAELTAELARLNEELYVRQGWRVPFAGDQPLRLYLARAESGGVRATAARATDKGRLVAPAILLDASALTTPEIVREVGRQVARATLAGYGIEDEFLLPAIAEYLSAPPAETVGAEAWNLGAAGVLDFRAHPEALGRIWVDEAVRQADGPAVLREAWQRAADSGEPPTAVLVRAVAEATGRSEEAILLGAAARLYALAEPEASPSRLRLLDVESGAIDASAPAPLVVRHRAFLPEIDETLRMAWPLDGGAGAAVVRYRDADLPPDVVLFAAGDRRSVPLAGVARVDWLVAGAAGGGRGVAAPAYGELAAGTPFNGLEARAAADSGGPRLDWTTASHEGMWGWAVFREEVLPSGRIARTGPEIIPSAESALSSYHYEFVDTSAASGTYYRYTVWAVTSEGVLARAFSTTVKSAD